MKIFITALKNRELPLFKIFGASGGSRNLISSLENLHTNRCTTLAKICKNYTTFSKIIKSLYDLWGGKSELNRRPSGPQSDALTI